MFEVLKKDPTKPRITQIVDRIARVKELEALILTTKEGVESIKRQLEVECTDDKIYTDGFTYNLSIGVHRDRSGENAELYRYSGNKEVLEAVLKVLEKQLEEFMTLFEEL